MLKCCTSYELRAIQNAGITQLSQQLYVQCMVACTSLPSLCTINNLKAIPASTVTWLWHYLHPNIRFHLHPTYHFKTKQSKRMYRYCTRGLEAKAVLAAPYNLQGCLLQAIHTHPPFSYRECSIQTNGRASWTSRHWWGRWDALVLICLTCFVRTFNKHFGNP